MRLSTLKILIEMNAAPSFPSAQDLGLDARHSKWYERGVQSLLDGKEKGQIIKTDFATSVSDINRGIETPYKNLTGKFEKEFNDRMAAAGVEHYSRWGAASREERELEDAKGYSTPTLHTIPGFLKKIQKIKGDLPQRDAIVHFLTTLLPLITLAKEVKEMQVSSRDLQAKAREEAGVQAKERTNILYQKVNVQKMDKALRELTEGHRADLEKNLLRDYSYQVEQIDSELDDIEGKVESGTIKSRAGMVQLVDLLEKNLLRLASLITTGTQPNKLYFPIMKSPDEVSTIIKKTAKDDADDIMGSFLARGANKLSEILAATSETKDVVLANVAMHRGLMEATINVTYVNGCQFSLRQQIVWVTNSHNTYFYRYPGTFHNVTYLKDGQLAPLKYANEALMNSEFVKSNPA